ncbi:MAG: phosphatase PAP2 family protein [Acidimicrobiaceae bacterium]|nr:phosphatase PAP2 family protein [Acidimicrobiaceae bacterium]
MDSVIVFVAMYVLYVSVIVTAWFWWRCSRTTQIELFVRLIIGGLLALLLATIGGHLYYDPRPFVTEHITPLFAHAPDNGFPSDHALLTSFLGFSVLPYSKKVGAVLLAIAVAVGAARVAAHVHSPIDIVGSFVFSAAAALTVQRVMMTTRVRTWWERRIARWR